jgi:hypothetical protein
MVEAKPVQITLCHASEDKEAVIAIYGRLKGLGYNPWWTKGICCRVSAGG